MYLKMLKGKIHRATVIQAELDYVGSITVDEELLEAARRIHEKHPETVFELLGAYEEETRARYEPMIEDLQSKGIMRYYG